MKTILINSSNYVANSGNQFIYIFPNNPTFKDEQICVVSCAIYNSTFNIEASRGNNVMQIIFNFATPVTLTITFDDGYYSVDQMNTFIQQAMIDAKYYLVNDQSQNVYFFELVTNSTYYAMQVTCYAIYTSAQATALNLTQPSGATWSYPVSASTTQLFIPSTSKWGDLIGFANNANFPTSVESTDQSFLSSKTPDLSPVNSYIMTSNLINSPYSNPTTILYGLPITTSFGNLITSSNNIAVWNDIAPNTYSSLILTFYDQHIQALRLHDPDVSIVLAFKNKSE